MEIEIPEHTLLRAQERGTNRDEIVDVLTSGFGAIGKYNRLGKAKVYEYKQHRQERYYEQKRVRVEVYYTVEDQKMITVTVYVFYGKWESQDAN